MISLPDRKTRWPWFPWLVGAVGMARILFGFWKGHPSVQQRNMQVAAVFILAAVVLSLWWLVCGSPRFRRRASQFGLLWTLLLFPFLIGRIKGVDGDLVPIWEWRWQKSSRTASASPVASPSVTPATETVSRSESRGSGFSRPDFPQFLGPERNAVLAGFRISTNWVGQPPAQVWRRAVGAAWSGFVIVGNIVYTQEQNGGEECVTAYRLESGEPLWRHSDNTRYFTTIAGEGPRATPTIASNRLLSLGATGRLNCLDPQTGKVHWTRDILADAGSRVPDWGVSGSPLVFQQRVIVSAGGTNAKSLLAYDLTTGAPVWGHGTRPLNYGSPALLRLAGREQIIAFNSERITSHDARDGTVIWEHPWGVGYPHVAMPIRVDDRRVFFSSGYGVGSELLEVTALPDGSQSVAKVWASKRMKAKFSNPVLQNGIIYGLDDGMMAAVDVQDGSQKWKSGRFGHGQGLWVGDLYLLMSEEGELVLMKPSAEGPGELARHRVFNSKTWNPIALSGEWLLVRNDIEAVALRVRLQD